MAYMLKQWSRQYGPPIRRGDLENELNKRHLHTRIDHAPPSLFWLHSRGWKEHTGQSLWILLWDLAWMDCTHLIDMGIVRLIDQDLRKDQYRMVV